MKLAPGERCPACEGIIASPVNLDSAEDDNVACGTGSPPVNLGSAEEEAAPACAAPVNAFARAWTPVGEAVLVSVRREVNGRVS